MTGKSLLQRPHFALIAIAAACLPLFLAAQDKPAPPETSAPAAAPTTPATYSYDVVSIKPYQETGQGYSSWWRYNDDGFSARGFTLRGLITNAYGIIMDDQLEGLPAWAKSDRYAVDAKMDDETTAAFKRQPPVQRWPAMQTMLQAVLADRFQLKLHKETRELPVYDLVVARGGLKVALTPEGKGFGYSMGSGKLSGNGVELDNLAFSLSNEVGRIIVNKTGLTGGYTMDLKWQPDSMAAGASNAPSAGPPLPDLFTALQEQAGLKLESAKGPVDVYVIDHVEKPSEN